MILRQQRLRHLTGQQALGGRNWGAFAVRTIAWSGARHPGKGGSLVRAGEQGEPERVYRFMSAHQAMYPIRTMARVLRVSASGYYT